MGESNNGESQSNGRSSNPKRHNAKLCPFAIRQRIVNALANGDSKRAIARRLRVSNNTVTAIAEQEWQQVDARKQRIVAQCERNATLAADQLAERLETEKLSANQLVPVFGVSVDKMLALTGQGPCLQIANVINPTPEEKAQREAIDQKLDEITRRLRDAAQTREDSRQRKLNEAGRAAVTDPRV